MGCKLVFKIDICTYNILNDHHAVKYKTFPGYVEVNVNGEMRIIGNWRERRDIILNDLLRSGCHILCLQEVSWDAFCYLEKNLENTSYAIAGYSQHANLDEKAPSSHGNVIIYDYKSVSLLGQKIIKSLKSQFVEEADGTKVSLSRGEIYADFSSNNTGVKFRVANTHLKGYDRFTTDLKKKNEDRLIGFQELEEVIKWMEKDSTGFDFLVITGDLNEGFEEIESPLSRLRLLQKNDYIFDGNETFSEPATDTKIDHIYIKPIAQDKESVQLVPLKVEMPPVLGSDHLLVRTQIVKSFVHC